MDFTFRADGKGKCFAKKVSGMKYDLYDNWDLLKGSAFLKNEKEMETCFSWKFRGLSTNISNTDWCITPFLNRLNRSIFTPKHSYVYAVYFGEGFEDLKYIGKGVGNRYLHCTSGMSHVKELNREYYTGGEIKVVVVKDSLTETEASDLEDSLIVYFKDYLVNVKGINKESLKRDWQDYYNISSYDLFACSKLVSRYQKQEIEVVYS